MERLTHKNNDAYYVDEIRHLYDDGWELIQALGKYEDLQEQLGIDLITLFKALKQDYIYYKHYYAWDNKFKINKEYLTGLKCIDDNTIALWAGEYSGKEHIVYLKDYGTKWSLRKEDLQDEKED